MTITAILPVSRLEYLDRVLESLEKQTIKPTALIAICDVPDENFLEFRNKVVGTPLLSVLCVQSNNTRPAFAISERRDHIASIHNQARDLIADSDWIFSVEDDGILPPNALERLLEVSYYSPEAGIITGVELGRWGVQYVGAWKVDDIYEPKVITSLENKAGEDSVEEIDACGLYCALINPKIYKDHEFHSDNGLGPDVNLALFSRQLGYKNYIDWGIPVTHLTNRVGVEIEIPATDHSHVVTLNSMGNNAWSQSKTGQTPSRKL